MSNQKYISVFFKISSIAVLTRDRFPLRHVLLDCQAKRFITVLLQWVLIVKSLYHPPRIQAGAFYNQEVSTPAQENHQRYIGKFSVPLFFERKKSFTEPKLNKLLYFDANFRILSCKPAANRQNMEFSPKWLKSCVIAINRLARFVGVFAKASSRDLCTFEFAYVRNSR